MEWGFSDEQQAVRDLARRILGDAATPERLAEAEAGQDRIDRGLWRDLASANLLGIAVPEEHGGNGQGILELCLLLEEQGRTVAPVPLHATLVLGALPLARFGTPEQQAEWLPRVASGDVFLTGVLPGQLVPSVHLAERIVVPSSDGVDLVAPADAPVSRQIGTTGEPVWTWDGDVAGNEWVAQAATVARCATMVGVAERAIRMTAEYLTGRQQFGRPLATFQAVQQRIADAYIDVQAMRVTALSAAWRLSQELPAAEEVAIAKFWAAEGGQRAVSAAQHLHGGVGVDLAYPLHRYTLWAKDIELTLGGAHEQLARIGAGLAAAYT